MIHDRCYNRQMDVPLTVLEPAALPPLLAEIPEPPRRLWCRGTLPDPARCTYLSVVGSRRHSPYGRDAVRHLIAGLTGYPIAIISGLALGIDALAHDAALAAGLPTVAFPGSGLDPDVLYPAENRGLAERIVAGGGALLSEYAPDQRATLETFPRRNRLMAGSSRATLVIEAGERSGTLITARLALDYNRDVLVVPGSIFSPTAIGTNRLLRQGATLISSPADILDALGFTPQPTLTTRADLDPLEQKLWTVLAQKSLTSVGIARVLGLTTAATERLLARAELKGLITSVAGRWTCR